MANKDTTERIDNFSQDQETAKGTIKNPRSTANIVSRVFFFWLDTLFCLGCTRSLKQEDVYACPDEAESEMLSRKFERHWQYELDRKKRGLKPRLSMALIKVCWWRFIIQGLVVVTEIALLDSQPIILGHLTDYFARLSDSTLNTTLSDNFTDCSPQLQAPSTRDAYLYATGLVLAALLIVVFHGHAFLNGQKIGMLMRVMTTSAIYKKVFSLSQVTIGRISLGHVINLASNDVHRLDMAVIFIHHLWIAPLQLCLFGYLVYAEFGWSAFLGIVFIITLLPLQLLFAKLFAWFRLKAALITDRRVRIMNEVIVGVRVIKMYAWEHAFKRVVKTLRRSEVLRVFKGGVIQSIATGFNQSVAQMLIIYITVLPSILSGNPLTPKSVFTTLSLINVVRLTVVVFTVRCFFTAYEGYVAIQRIQQLLELEELSPNKIADDQKNSKTMNGVDTVVYGIRRESTVKLLGMNEHVQTSGLDDTCEPVVEVKVYDLCASWSNEFDKLALNDVSFEVNQDNSLLAIVGHVGSGKSTLLQCLLGELKYIKGSVYTKGHLSYTSQEPWIFSETVRENILFGSRYDPDRYNEVVKACTLDKDFTQLINGDMTIVGERGVTLSGGQKARVSLARAVYRDADIYLLDDPLSAVDTAVAKHLFDECIRGLLRDKLVILVTHQVQFALEADKLLALKEGHVEIYGSHSDLAERGIDTTVLLGLIKEEDKEDKFKYRDGSDDDDENQTVSTSPSSLSARVNLLSVPGVPRQQRNFRHTDSDSFDETQLHDEFDELPFDNVSIYSAPSMLSINSAVHTATSKHEGDKHVVLQGPPSEERAHGNVSLKTYYGYFRAGGNFLYIGIVFVMLFLSEGGVVISDWWLTDWANCDFRLVQSDACREVMDSSATSTCQLSRNERISIYSATVLSTVVIVFLRCTLLYVLCINASRVLHNKMFASVLRAPVHFFDTNPSGRILNRFSKDVGFLDDLLPQAFLEFLQLFIRFLAVLLTGIIANQWLLIPATIVIIVFILFRWYYLKTARDVKRLEAIARSPIYSHISTTLQGLPIIRIFEKQNVAQQQLHHFLNVHSQGWYLYLATTRWFGMRIDLLTAGFLASVAFTSIPLGSQLNPELVGLSLVYTVALSGAFQYCIRQSAEIENIMISTERIKGYSKLEPEASLETLIPDHKPPPEWPAQGQIILEDVAFQYSNNLPLVLKNLDLTIQPGEKIGVVGRTGAGKSSLLSMLYRLAEPFGLITIDGVDIKSIGLHDLRSKMSIIPQDPVLFSGTMRYNLDPFDEFSDSNLWDVLEQVQLKVVVEQLEGQLSGEVSEGGSNFSVGQKQLICLARALFRKNKILILDEATANVDPRTDEIIQQTIRNKFLECTVITIAHRLNTIMDSDRILVMSSGQIKEFDQPYTLLQNPDSLLLKWWKRLGLLPLGNFIKWL